MRVRANVNLTWLRRGEEKVVANTEPYLGMVEAGYLIKVDDLTPTATLTELRAKASALEIPGRSSMTKDELAEAISAAADDD